MWLYVPSHCLPETADSISGLVSPDRCAAFVWSKGKPMRSLYWLRAWQRGGWIRRLSGLTLQPLQAANGVAKWISSLPPHPASPTALQESARGTTTPAAGMLSNTSPESSMKFDHPWSLWKTSASGSQVDIFETSESAYTDWVTESRRRSLSLREALARRIGGNGFSFWPTATVHSSESRKTEYAQGGTPLSMAAELWPTATANDETGSQYAYSKGDHSKQTPKLAGAAMQWPTPRLNTGPDKSERHKSLDGAASQWATPRAEDSESSGMRHNRNTADTLTAQSGLWETPTTQNRKSRKALTPSTGNGRRSGGGNSSTPGLEQQAELMAGVWPAELDPDNMTPATAAMVEALWPTPAARDHKGTNSADHLDKSSGSLHLDQLPNFVEYRFSHPDPATPTRGGSFSSTTTPSPQHWRRRLLTLLREKYGDLSGTVSPASIAARAELSPNEQRTLFECIAESMPRRLNPGFTEWLMQWPRNWTTAHTGCGVPETEFSRWQQQSHSMFCYLTSDVEAAA